MKLTLISTRPLQPYLERIPSPHQLTPVYLPENPSEYPAFLQAQFASPGDADAILLADGAHCLADDGFISPTVPLVMPRVHNAAALLLGGAARYRQLFGLHDGALCWWLPLWPGELIDTPRADCDCLYYLADTALALPDESLRARARAQQNGWDYCNIEADYSLLSRLLSGEWDEPDILVVPHGQAVYPSCSRALLALRD